MNSRRRTITSISMVFLAVTILSVSALGQNAYAAMSLSVDADYDNGNISVSGDTDRTGDVTIKVTAGNGNLVSVDQVTPSGGTFSSTIKVSLDGTYTVSAQQGTVSAYMLSVAVSSSEPSGTSSTGSTSPASSVVTATLPTVVDSTKYPTGVKTPDEQARFLIEDFQSLTLLQQYQIIIVENNLTRLGSLEGISLSKSGSTPVTWKANLKFISGDVVVVGE